MNVVVGNVYSVIIIGNFGGFIVDFDDEGNIR